MLRQNSVSFGCASLTMLAFKMQSQNIAAGMCEH